MGYKPAVIKDGAVFVLDITDIFNSNHFYSNIFSKLKYDVCILYIYLSVYISIYMCIVYIQINSNYLF